MAFKIGDKVRGKNSSGVWKWTGTVTEKWKMSQDIPEVVWAYWVEKDESPHTHPTYLREKDVELVTPAPLTFEVGKSYKLNDKWINNIYTVEFVSPITGAALATTESNGKIVSARLADIKKYSEVVLPPPEEWRALYWRRHGKPEISAATWESKEAVEKDEKSHTHFMYAIRTDINAKKEN